MPSLTKEIAPNSPLHSRILTEVRDRVRFSERKYQARHDKWAEDEEKALAFLPERAADAKRRGEREEGKPQYTTVVVPYSYAVLMASHTYWTTVFLGRSPIMQYAGLHGEGEMQVQAVEALIDYQIRVGGMLVPLYLWLLDAGKYGVGIVGHYWDEQVVRTSEIREVEDSFFGIPTGKKKKQRFILDIPGYVGNRLYNVRPYDFLPDPRVPLHRFQEGEFVSVKNEVSWHEALNRFRRGMYTNLDRVRKGDRGGIGDRTDGSSQLELPDFGDPAFGDRPDRNTNTLKVYECYITLIPEKWNLGRGDRNEKWVFTTTQDFKTVVGAQPFGAWHDRFPFEVIEFEPEAYALLNRSIPEILDPVQRTVDWLINTHFYNVRKVLNDQFVVDPSRIVMRDATDPLPGGLIRLKPAAYGTDTRTAMTQLNVQDVTQLHIQDMQMMIQIGERVLGVNDQILGALQGGGRKTATEIRSSTTFGISRLKTVSEYFSAMGWSPLGQVLVQASQQYYELERKLRIVGDAAQLAGPQFIDVNPETIQGFYEYVPVDGTLPVDRFAQANLWREILAQMRNMPDVALQYDIAKIFSWVARLAGLKNIDQFRIQVVPDQAAAGAAAAGNLIPMPTGSQPRRLQNLEGVSEPGQISGMGATA